MTYWNIENNNVDNLVSQLEDSLLAKIESSIENGALNDTIKEEASKSIDTIIDDGLEDGIKVYLEKKLESPSFNFSKDKESIIGIQSALHSFWFWEIIWAVDWNIWANTKLGVRAFQKSYNALVRRGKIDWESLDADGDAWRKTVEAIVMIINDKKLKDAIKERSLWLVTEFHKNNLKIELWEDMWTERKERIKLKENEHFLTEEEFSKYFNDDYFVQWIWNCWLVSAIDGIQKLDVFKKMMLMSTIVETDWYGKTKKFVFWLPLGEPWATGYEVTAQEIYTAAKNPKSPMLVEQYDNSFQSQWNFLWYNALLHAYGQRVTGERNFDFYRLNSQKPQDFWNELKTLLWTENISVETTQDRRMMKILIQQFNAKKQVMIARVRSISKTTIEYWSLVNADDVWNHSITIEGYDGTNILVSDPNLAATITKYPLSDFLKKIWKLSVWYIETESAFDFKTSQSTKESIPDDRSRWSEMYKHYEQKKKEGS